jgi:L-lactate dehydrogenase complex protein LldE
VGVRVGLFVPCFVDTFYPRVAVATVRVLEHLGVDVDYPLEQTCCGQPHYNAGKRAEARELAQRFCQVFADYDTIVCPSGSCTSMVRNHYPSLLEEESEVPPRVLELGEFLVDRLGVIDVGARLKGRAALHVGCHALREIKVGGHARALMAKVEGLEVVPLASDTWCCGFGGTFSVKFPEISAAMGARKLAPMASADVDYLVSTDSSCLMHLGGLLSRAGKTRPTLMHVAEVLATGLEAT